MREALFISRAGADAEFAAVVGEILEAAGYTVILQQWDFANRNFTERMHAALAEGARVVALLSPEYLTSQHCQAEWQNAIADDPLNMKSRLILLRVVECEPPGLLSGLAYWDLVPVRDNRPLLQDIVTDAVGERRREGATSGPYWRVPRTIVDAEAIRPVPSFSGRETELAAIAAGLASEHGIAVVHGMGGVGKSSVAREYAWRNRDEYSLIWWLNAQAEDAIIDGLLRLGALFVRGLEQHADRRAAAQQVITSVLRGFSKPSLLVFDNLEDERLLRAWQPRSGSHILVTSRNAAWSADLVPIPVQTWPLEIAIHYLRRESGRGDLGDADTRAIAEALGALPLALAHAAASLRGMRMMKPSQYLQRIEEHLKSAPRSADYPRSVFATFTTAIAQAEKEAAGAAAALNFAASFAPDAIPDELFRQPAAMSAFADEFSLNEALGALDRLSLLAFSEKSSTYDLHRLVQLAARDTRPGDALLWTQRAIEAAETAFPKVEFAAWSQCERLLPHARAALDSLPEDIAFVPAGHLANRCAMYLRERGDYPAAETLQLRALAISAKAFGPDSTEAAGELDHLAVLYWREGRYEEAKELLLRVLSVLENVLGPDHPDVATALNDLGMLYFQQGRYADAEPLLTRAVALREKALGADHRGVGLILNNLANLYCEQGRYAEGETLQKRTLAIAERNYGPDHPLVATSLNNLGSLYEIQERFDEAEPLFKRASAIWESGLGPNHPDLALSLTSLGNIYYNQGRYDDAEPLLARALAIKEKTLGRDHSSVGESLNALAALHCGQGRYEEAEALFVRALTTLEKSLGAHHLKVAATLIHFASLRETQGRLDEAESLNVRALTIRESAMGRDHGLTNAVREKLHALRSQC